MPEYGIECNWKCTEMVQLRIDAAGGIMLCNEYRTKLADKYNIGVSRLSPAGLQLHPWMDDLLSDWLKVREKLDCTGCYWSCFIQAEENIRRERLEFDFFTHSFSAPGRFFDPPLLNA